MFGVLRVDMTEKTSTATSLIALLPEEGSDPQAASKEARLLPARAAVRVVTVVVAHQHRLLLDSLVRLFDEIKGVQVVDTADTEDALLDSVSRIAPDVVVFEPFQPHPRDLGILGRLRRVSPETRSLVILRTLDPAQLLRALRSGASGYFSYETTANDIVRAIEVIQRGELWVQRGVMQRLLLEGGANDPIATDEENAPARTREDPSRELSRRELEVAAHVVAGLCNKRIATTLRITESTVKTHMVNIFRKLDIENRTQLVRYLGAARRRDSMRQSTDAAASVPAV
jgi:DNA-binding NarL/FixJ family response regulator